MTIAISAITNKGFFIAFGLDRCLLVPNLEFQSANKGYSI